MKKFLCFLGVFTLLILTCVPVFAFDISEYQPLPTSTYSNVLIYKLNDTGDIVLKYTDGHATYDGSRYVNYHGVLQNYLWKSSTNEWVADGGGTTLAIDTNARTFLYSSYDIVNVIDNTVFFSAPPPPVVALAHPQNLLQSLLVHLPVIIPVGILLLCLVALVPRLITWVPRLFLG